MENQWLGFVGRACHVDNLSENDLFNQVNFFHNKSGVLEFEMNDLIADRPQMSLRHCHAWHFFSAFFDNWMFSNVETIELCSNSFSSKLHKKLDFAAVKQFVCKILQFNEIAEEKKSVAEKSDKASNLCQVDVHKKVLNFSLPNCERRLKYAVCILNPWIHEFQI